MRKKFSQLGETATGKQSSVLRSKPKAGLTEVYAAAKLPAVKTLQKLPRGERRMLEERKLMDFVARVYQPTSSQPKATRTTKAPKQHDQGGRPRGR
jgi:hypothetical protein